VTLLRLAVTAGSVDTFNALGMCAKQAVI